MWGRFLLPAVSATPGFREVQLLVDHLVQQFVLEVASLFVPCLPGELIGHFVEAPGPVPETNLDASFLELPQGAHDMVKDRLKRWVEREGDVGR
mmetsp:Transcript_22696/g.36491  ORF Transcript_22696/g.36491 Transcript_22696/m.36491 type:complete len:94 (+) Transcript_22696:412-693(+)